MNSLWFGLSLNDAIERPRLHHNLYPNSIYYEKNSPFKVPQFVLNGLKALGHELTGGLGWSAEQGVYRDKSGKLYAKSDPRKGGVAVVL